MGAFLQRFLHRIDSICRQMDNSHDVGAAFKVCEVASTCSGTTSSSATHRVAARLAFAAILPDLRPLPAAILEVFRDAPSPLHSAIASKLSLVSFRVSAFLTFASSSECSFRS